MTSLQAGAAAEVVTPELGRGMAGYASRTGVAEAVLDDLYCRVAVFADSATTLVVVAFDLIYIPARLSSMVTEAVAAALSTTPDRVLVAASHTHCGPAVAGPGSDELLRELAAAARRCASRAWETRADVHLVRTEFGVADLAHHRREPPEQVDDSGHVLLALSPTGEVVASLLSVACHPTVLEGDTLAYSRDYPGALCDAVEALCGGTAIFLQGFAGDTNPAFLDHQAADVRSFGALLGARAAAAILTAQRGTRESWTINLSHGAAEPVPASHAGRAVPPTALDGRLVEVGVEAKPATDRAAIRSSLDEARRELAAATTTAERQAAAAVETQWWIEDLICDNPPYLGLDLPPAEQSTTLPVQVFTLGAGLQLIAFPGEPLHSAATALREALGDKVLLVGYAHRAASYLPGTEHFPHHGYEVGSTRYQPGTVERLIAAAIATASETAATDAS